MDHSGQSVHSVSKNSHSICFPYRSISINSSIWVRFYRGMSESFTTENMHGKHPSILCVSLWIVLRMFDRFNHHWFQSLKLLKLIADMILHGWLKFWARLPVWYLNFEKQKFANFTRCHMDTNLKNTSFQRFMEKVNQKLLQKKNSVSLNTPKFRHRTENINSSSII